MSRAARAIAIVNPAAGRGAGRRLMATFAGTLADAGLPADVVATPGPGDGARLARQAVDDGYDLVIAVGGDGTANEVASGIVGTPVALGLYPLGTGNDFARNLGYPPRRRDVPRFLARARRRTIDAGELNGRLFVNHVGVGIDGVVAERARAYARLAGPLLGYAAASLASIVTYRPEPMRVWLDGELRSGRYLVIVVSNGVHFGSGMKAAPQALLDDGWFDATLAGDLGRVQAVAALLRLYRGTHVDGVRIVAARVRSVEIELERRLPAELDGEVTRLDRLAISLRPRALTVLAA